MKMTNVTRQALRIRRERRDLLAAGYRQHETDWEIHRGCRMGEKIVDAIISCDGMYVYTKTAMPADLKAAGVREIRD